jgi:hypothetical protein
MGGAEKIIRQKINSPLYFLKGLFIYLVAGIFKGISRFNISSLVAISQAVSKMILVLFSIKSKLIFSTLSVGLW